MRARSGVSLAELIVALGLFSIILATTLGFYRQQGEAFAQGNERMTLMQNMRYGVTTLEQNLRTAGIGVPMKQPVLIYAGEDVIAFNADYATRTEGDIFAVYHDPRLPAGEASAVTTAGRFLIPRTSFFYPDSSYYAGSGNSPAETIVFYFEPDATTPRSDDYVLYRQVNGGERRIVARNLISAGGPFFTYYRTVEGASTPVQPVPSGQLPLRHTAPIHGSAADTGVVARIDSVRAVRVAYAATNGFTDERETTRRIERLIRLPNAGLDTPRSCGNRPLLGTALLATTVGSTETDPAHIRLAWNPAIDESSGERDVIRYVIWRKTAAGAPWGDPMVSISPGASSYLYLDTDIVAGQQYWYALAAQDCTPQYSDVSTAGPLTGPG